VTSKQKNILRLPAQPDERTFESFRFAFFVKGFQYTDSLVYADKKVEEMNDSKYEPNLQKLSKENVKVL
jgi:hypothetical protein